MNIGFLADGEEGAWGAFVDNHAQGTIYHTLAWKKVTEEGLGHQAYYLRAISSAGDITGVLPLFLVKGIYGLRLVSMPMRDRGGPLAINSEISTALIGAAIDVTVKLKGNYLELRCPEALEQDIVQKNHLTRQQNWIDTRVDLTQGEDALWKKLDKDSERWAIRKALRQGVRVDIENTQKGIDIFFDLFAKTRTAMGIPPFPKVFFNSMYEHIFRPGWANLFIVWKDTIPINAVINFISKDTLIGGYAAPQKAWHKYSPSDVVFWTILVWAINHGFRWYDFGSDSLQQSSLLAYKAKWGGMQNPMSYYFFQNKAGSPPNFDSSTPAYEYLRRAWRHLPLNLSTWLGGWITRQLS